MDKNCKPVAGQRRNCFLNPFRKIIYLLGLLVIAYAYEFVWLAMDSKGQYQTDYAWEVLAHEVLSREYHGEPQMRVTYAKPSFQRCNFWIFETVWGGCVSVKIGIDVRDYRSEYRAIVEREVERLAEQMRRPCRLLLGIGLENEAKLAKNIGCNSIRKRFGFYFWINEVSIVSEKGPLERPNRWSPNMVKHIYTTEFIEGEL